MADLMSVSRRVKKLREDRGISQDELGVQIGRSGVAISNLEIGRTKVPCDVLAKFVEYFNVSADYLLGFTDNPSRLYSTYNDSEERDLISGFRQMDRSQRRILIGEMERILYDGRTRNAGL